MDPNEWKLEMNRMLDSFANQAEFSLGKINRFFEALGRPFDEKFRQYFLKMSHQRLDMSYDTIQFAKDTAPCNETGNCTNTNTPTEDNATLVNPVKKENTIAVKAEKVGEGTMIEIYDSDDDKNSGMQAPIDLTDEYAERIKSNASQEHTITDQNTAELKHEPNAANECESVDIPLVEFDANEDSGSVVPVSERGEGSTTQPEVPPLNTVIDKSIGIGGMRYNCNHCQHSFKFKCILKKHQRIHANGKLVGVKADSNGLYRCGLCIRRFVKVTSLSAHMKMMHKDGRYLFYCTRCMCPFVREAEKDKHETQCEGRHYECHLCKVFVTSVLSSMQRHMRWHSGVNPFHCKRCDKTFATMSSCRYHLSFVNCRVRQ